MEDTRELFKDLEANQKDLVKDLQDAELELTILENQKKSSLPGVAINQMMRNWGKEPVHND